MTDKVSLIRTEIERLMADLGEQRDVLLEELLEFINSLPEEPVSEDLEEAVEECISSLIPEQELDSVTPFSLEFVVALLHKAFKASAQWQKEQMMKKRTCN